MNRIAVSGPIPTISMMSVFSVMIGFLTRMYGSYGSGSGPGKHESPGDGGQAMYGDGGQTTIGDGGHMKSGAGGQM